MGCCLESECCSQHGPDERRTRAPGFHDGASYSHVFHFDSMDSDIGGGLIAEKEALEAVARDLFALLAPGDFRVVYSGTLLSTVTYERVRVFRVNGNQEAPDGRYDSIKFPYATTLSVVRLREASFRERTGTWFSLTLSVTAERSVTAVYNYDDEPDWDSPVDPVAYVNDAKKFPRDEVHQPEWLKQRLSEGQAPIDGRE